MRFSFLPPETAGKFPPNTQSFAKVGVEEIEGLMEHFCNQETLFVVSSDLSHYYDDDTARRIDSHCHAWIERGEETSMNVCEACGKRGIEGALSYARKRGLIARLVAYGTSADTSGDRGRVVGYGGYVFTR
ncbi:MAG: AmmeMemoRadiSam system protein B [Aquificaceae bacterium]